MSRALSITLALATAVLWAHQSLSQPRSGAWICELSAYVMRVQESRFTPVAEFSGRGLVTCRNNQGFNIEVPIQARVTGQMPETKVAAETGGSSLSLTSAPFVVNRDLSQLYDEYDAHIDHLRVAAGDGTSSLLMKGKGHELYLGLNVATSSLPSGEIKISTLNMQFDGSAPALF